MGCAEGLGADDMGWAQREMGVLVEGEAKRNSWRHHAEARRNAVVEFRIADFGM
jgi:hypothetical protein